MQDDKHSLPLDNSALPVLKAFAEQFLSSSYNLLMGGLRRDLEPGLNISRLSEDDFLRFFKLAGFFTRFVRQQQVRYTPTHPICRPAIQAFTPQSSSLWRQPSQVQLAVPRKNSRRSGAGLVPPPLQKPHHLLPSRPRWAGRCFTLCSLCGTPSSTSLLQRQSPNGTCRHATPCPRR
jgi:hypothetical protein